MTSAEDRGSVPGFLSGESTPPARVRHVSPLLSFLLSLLLPGLGHFYCRKWKRGFGTLALFLLGCVFAVIFLPQDETRGQRLGETGFLLALGMYVFGFLDSYFVAREINEGVDEFLVTNPRVAAVLNFLTNGLGYFYVGQRTKGIVLFVLLYLADRVLLNVKVTTLAPLLVVVFGLLRIGMAVDAYRIAVREGQDIRTVLPQSGPAPPGGLPQGVPLTLAFLFVAAYLGLALLSGVYESVGLTDEELAAELADSEDNKEGEVRALPAKPSGASSPARSPVPEGRVADSKTWSNPRYGLKLAIPMGWHELSGDRAYTMAATSPGGHCLVTVSVAPSSGLPALPDYMADASAKFLSVNTNARIRERGSTTLGSFVAEQVVYDVDRSSVNFVEVHVLTMADEFVYAYRSVGPVGHACEAEVIWIRNRVEITVPSEE